MEESVENGIIERTAQKPELGLAGYKDNPRLKFKLFMAVIEGIFAILQKELDEGIEEPTLLEFKKALNQIAGSFYDLYRDPSIGNKLIRKEIQPLINKASNKLEPALAFKKEGKLEEYLNQLTDLRDLLYELDEYLITVQAQLDKS